MIVFEFPMIRKDGSDIELKHILPLIAQNCRSTCAELKWSILEGFFIGKAPNGLSMDELDDLILLYPEGYLVTWDDLKKNSEDADRIYDFWVVGVKPGVKIDVKKLISEDFSGCEVVIDVAREVDWQLRFAEAGDD